MWIPIHIFDQVPQSTSA